MTANAIRAGEPPATVLVTGGTGFVAGWVIVELLQRGYRVRATLRDLRRGEALARELAAASEDAADGRGAAGAALPVERLHCVAADLDADAGWREAAEGCEYVLHVASPLGTAGVSGEQLIATARAGTRRVLEAALAAGARKVVLTSSTAACTPAQPLARAIDEGDWTDPEQPGLAPYRASKLLAERDAWAIMAGQRTALATILPGAIFGPVLRADQTGSVDIIRRLLDGTPPALPRLAFNITDVRDLARLHVDAMTSAAADGERFIAMGDALWYGEIADALRQQLGDAAHRVPTRRLPDIAARALALVSPQMKQLLPLLGRTQRFSSDKARRLLGFAPRPPRETVVDCARSLLR